MALFSQGLLSSWDGSLLQGVLSSWMASFAGAAVLAGWLSFRAAVLVGWLSWEPWAGEARALWRKGRVFREQAGPQGPLQLRPVEGLASPGTHPF